MNTAVPTGNNVFRTQYLTCCCTIHGMVVSALGLCADASWSDVQIYETVNGAVLVVGNALARLSAEDYQLLQPVIENFQTLSKERRARDTIAETTERARLGTTTDADVDRVQSTA